MSYSEAVVCVLLYIVIPLIVVVIGRTLSAVNSR